FTESCAPPPGLIGLSPTSAFTTRSRALGEQIEKATLISSANIINAPIREASDLLCYDFDDSCHWHNMEFGIDKLTWYQGAGTLDPSRLQVILSIFLKISTSTSTSPEGTYAIVATDSVKLPRNEAVLVSDVIECQKGSAELRFMYWSSPDVQITVCTKRTTRIYPDFDFCNPPIETGDPGPAFLIINNVDQQPFQIFIRASNFVFRAPNLEGGFAIIDNIEYYGELCSGSLNFVTDTTDEQVPDESTHVDYGDHHFAFPETPNSLDSKVPYETFEVEEFTSDPLLAPITTSPFATSLTSMKNNMAVARDFVVKITDTGPLLTLCNTLHCNFSTSPCNHYVRGSEWRLSHGPVGKSSRGIGGDASQLPYNPDGAFVYIKGPVDRTRLIIPPFVAKAKFYFAFWYHKSSKYNKLRVLTKRNDEEFEHTLYMAPENNKNSRKWFKEIRILPAGPYDYIAFEAGDLDKDDYVAVDQLTVLDGARNSICTPTTLSTSL
ncbi:unnamed protein product, partial [Enterobius vermicularis]|uniref:MAM domain-containing protein n=1 Tax=Enterobius vermicularis TaxID=51028 RepID=A0A0N4VAI9_ENTVE